MVISTYIIAIANRPAWCNVNICIMHNASHLISTDNFPVFATKANDLYTSLLLKYNTYLCVFRLFVPMIRRRHLLYKHSYKCFLFFSSVDGFETGQFRWFVSHWPSYEYMANLYMLLLFEFELLIFGNFSPFFVKTATWNSQM